MSLIEQLRAQLDSGFKPEIDGETLQRIVTALEAGKSMSLCLQSWRDYAIERGIVVSATEMEIQAWREATK